MKVCRRQSAAGPGTQCLCLEDRIEAVIPGRDMALACLQHRGHAHQLISPRPGPGRCILPSKEELPQRHRQRPAALVLFSSRHYPVIKHAVGSDWQVADLSTKPTSRSPAPDETNTQNRHQKRQAPNQCGLQPILQFVNLQHRTDA